MENESKSYFDSERNEYEKLESEFKKKQNLIILRSNARTNLFTWLPLLYVSLAYDCNITIKIAIWLTALVYYSGSIRIILFVNRELKKLNHRKYEQYVPQSCIKYVRENGMLCAKFKEPTEMPEYLNGTVIEDEENENDD